MHIIIQIVVENNIHLEFKKYILKIKLKILHIK